MAARNLHEIRERYAPHVAVLYRHFPLTTIHPHANGAAIAAECASAQGVFESFHDLLYAEQTMIGITEWTEFADRAGIPSLTDFATCIADTTLWPAERVAEDVKLLRASVFLEHRP